jgi:Dna[CI] antecedent, DciA
MERVGDEVRRELGRFGPIEGDTTPIVRAWPVAVGETVARNAWPARLASDGTLHVNTSSSTWAFELGRLAATILAQLRDALGSAAPRALKFVPGPLPEARPTGLPATSSRGREPTAEELAAGAEIAAGIEGEELRRLVARAAAASLAKGSAEPPDDRRF